MTTPHRLFRICTKGLVALLLPLSIGSMHSAHAADPVITIKFSHVAAKGTPKSDAAELFKSINVDY